MSYFKDICLLKAPQYFELPHPFVVSDLTELCYLASVVKDDVNSIAYLQITIIIKFTKLFQNF